MDMRTWKLYESSEAAMADGVPERFVANVNVVREETGEVVTITSGPFKGRRYARNSDGTLGRRIREAVDA